MIETSAMSRNITAEVAKNAWKMHRMSIAVNLNVENMNFAEDAKRQVIDEKMALIKEGEQE